MQELKQEEMNEIKGGETLADIISSTASSVVVGGAGSDGGDGNSGFGGGFAAGRYGAA